MYKRQTYLYARAVLGDKASYLKLGMVNPLPVRLIQEFAAKIDTLYVMEELDDVIETHCRKIGVKVIGKELFPWIGEFSQKLIAEKLFGKAEETYAFPEAVPMRPPVLCAGSVSYTHLDVYKRQMMTWSPMKRTLSAASRANPISWVTTIIVMCSCANSRITASTSPVS